MTLEVRQNSGGDEVMLTEYPVCGHQWTMGGGENRPAHFRNDHVIGLWPLADR